MIKGLYKYREKITDILIGTQSYFRGKLYLCCNSCYLWLCHGLCGYTLSLLLSVFVFLPSDPGQPSFSWVHLVSPPRMSLPVYLPSRCWLLPLLHHMVSFLCFSRISFIVHHTTPHYAHIHPLTESFISSSSCVLLQSS